MVLEVSSGLGKRLVPPLDGCTTQDPRYGACGHVQHRPHRLAGGKNRGTKWEIQGALEIEVAEPQRKTGGKKMKVIRAQKLMVALPIALTAVMALPLPAGAHPYHDEYVNKLSQGTSERVSVSSSGAEGNGDSGWTGCGSPKYSANDDGRFVAFASQAGNLDPADINGQVLQDVFVYDRKKSQTHLVSAMPDGLAPMAPTSVDLATFPCSLSSHSPTISGNGLYVAFVSDLPLTGDAETAVPMNRVFVRDLRKQRTELISRTWNGDPPTGSLTPEAGFFGLSISDNGRFVAFESNITNLTKEDPCAAEVVTGLPNPFPALGCRHIYVRDRRTEQTIIASRSTKGDLADAVSMYPHISGNGNHVTFESSASNLSDEGLGSCSTPFAPSCTDVFVRDLKVRETELVSVSRDGTSANNPSYPSDISKDGRFILFTGRATDLVPANFVDAGPQFRCGATYLRDRKTGRTERISVTSTGSMLQSWGGSISSDGRHVAFHPDHNNNFFCHPAGQHSYWGGAILDRSTGQADWRTFVRNFQGEDEAPSGVGFGFQGNSTMHIGGNGRFIYGPSEFENVIDDDRNEAIDMFVRDIGTPPLGVGLDGTPPSSSELPPDSICVAPGACVPSRGMLSWRAPSTTNQTTVGGAKLYGASLAYRPELGDLYAAIELEDMGPSLIIGPAGVTSGGPPSLLYGLRFAVEGRRYEVRATSLLGGTFGLFHCTDSGPLCTQVAKLEGGYGTTGERVVISLPLEEIGLDSGGEIAEFEVFSALGSYASGVQAIYDRLKIR